MQRHRWHHKRHVCQLKPKIEQKKQKNCDRANKKINKRKGCLDTNKQSDRL